MAKRETLGATLDQSYVQRVARGALAFGRVLLGGGADWFGPQEPLPPQAPAEVAGRQFDYPVGYNLWQQPKIYEGVDFASLRALADNYDVLRLLIETRKDQMCGLPWAIKRRDPTAKGDDPRIAGLETFFRRPDGINTWSRWLRLLLEDLLVIDAPTLYVSRNRGGKALAFQVMDGATIKPVIDDFGRRPAPPAPAYQQVLKGLPAVDYTANDLLYLPRNQRPHRVYGFSPVEQMQMTVNIALRRQIYQLQYYTEGNIPEALIGVPDAWNPDQIKQFQSYWDMLHEGDGAARRHAKFVPGGVAKTFIPIKEPELKGVFDEWLARVACYCFSVSPQPFVSAMNRATAETAADTAKAEGTEPTKQWVKEMIDDSLARDFEAPDLEFSWTEESALDPAVQATTINTYVRAGVMTINEGRAQLGLDPINEGDTPLIYTAAGAVTLESVLEPPAPVPPQLPPPGEGGKPPAGGAPDASQERRGADAVDDPAPTGTKAKIAKFLSPPVGALDDMGIEYSADDPGVTGPERKATQRIKEALAAWLALFAGQRDRLWLIIVHIQEMGVDPAGVQAQALIRREVSEIWHADVVPTLGPVVDDMGAILGAAASHGVQVADAGATAQIDLSAAMIEAQSGAQNRAAEMLGLKFEGGRLTDNPDAVNSIASSTINMITAALVKTAVIAADLKQQPSESHDAPGSPSSPDRVDGKKILADVLKNNAAFSGARASAIGFVEAFAGFSGGVYAAAQAMGALYSVWVEADDEACSICKINADASPLPIGARYPSGDRHPTAHSHCRCTQRFLWLRPAAKSAVPQEVGAQLPFDLGKSNPNHDPRNGQFASGLAAFLAGGLSGTRVVARLPQDIQAHLGSRSARVLLSAETVASHGHHAWTVADFAHLQGVLDHGEVRADRKNHVVVAHRDGEWWVAVLKVTSDRKTTYLQSFRRSNVDQIERIGVRGPLVRSGKGN